MCFHNVCCRRSHTQVAIAGCLIFGVTCWSFGFVNLLIRTNKCLGETFIASQGGYVKSNIIHGNTSEVFKHFQSEHGVKGFLNYNLPTDKATTHNYTRYYDTLLQPYLRRSGLYILEVGVKMGGSLMLWRELFPSDAMIYGIDIDPEVPMFDKDAHIKVLAGIASTDGTAISRAMEGFQFDIIVDDGSHLAVDQADTLYVLWKYLTEDGLYIIEDVDNDCSLMRMSLLRLYKPDELDFRDKPIGELLEGLPSMLTMYDIHPRGTASLMTVHQSREQRLFMLYPTRSLAIEYAPQVLTRCVVIPFERDRLPDDDRHSYTALAEKPPCAAVMSPCGLNQETPSSWRSP